MAAKEPQRQRFGVLRRMACIPAAVVWGNRGGDLR